MKFTPEKFSEINAQKDELDEHIHTIFNYWNKHPSNKKKLNKNMSMDRWEKLSSIASLEIYCSDGYGDYESRSIPLSWIFEDDPQGTIDAIFAEERKKEEVRQADIKRHNQETEAQAALNKEKGERKLYETLHKKYGK